MSLLTLSYSLRSLVNADFRRASAILSQAKNREQLLAFRDQAFTDLVKHCYEHVPYYRNWMQANRVQPGDIKGLKDISIFPVLTKEIIREQGPALRADNIDLGTCTFRRSGGTTGEPIGSYVSPLAARLETLSFLRGLKWMGWDPSHKTVVFSGGSLGTGPSSFKQKLRGRVLKRVFLPAFSLNKENAGEYIRKIQDAGPCLLSGYSSVLYNLSRLALEQGYKVTNVYLISNTAEQLTDAWMDVIKQAFSCPVKCYYGSGEVNSLGYQLIEKGPYIIPEEHVHLETETADPDGSPLLITPLYNYAQPLIRFRNGDAARIEYSAGTHPMYACINPLLGRTADMFTKADGTRVSSALGPHIIAMTRIPVDMYQFVQLSTGQIEFRYQAKEELTPGHASEIKRILKELFGETTQVDIYRDKPFETSGSRKHRIMVNLIS